MSNENFTEESGGDAKKDEENRRGSTGNLVEEDEMEEPFENGATTRGVFHEAGENDSVAVVGDEESLDVNADRQPETVDETSTEDEEEQVSSCIHEMHLKHYQKGSFASSLLVILSFFKIAHNAKCGKYQNKERNSNLKVEQSCYCTH